VLEVGGCDSVAEVVVSRGGLSLVYNLLKHSVFRLTVFF
jgi:hypothetical protein